MSQKWIRNTKCVCWSGTDISCDACDCFLCNRLCVACCEDMFGMLSGFTRIRVFPLSFLRDPVMFPWFSGGKRPISCIFPVTGYSRKRTVPGTEFSRGNTASMFRVYFRPVPAGNQPEPAGIRGKKRRFLRDPSGSVGGKHRPGQKFVEQLRDGPPEYRATCPEKNFWFSI